MRLNEMKDQSEDEKLVFQEDQIKSILQKFELLKEERKDKIVIMDWNVLERCLEEKEIEIITKLKRINPKKYGFNGHFLGFHLSQNNLVKIAGQRYFNEEKEKEIGVQYLPENVFHSFTKMNEKMMAEIDRKLLVESGYRSYAYQTVVFLWYLDFFKYDLKKTFERVALPGYSEHGCGMRQGIDVMTVDGKPSEKNPYDFVDTVEYDWLKKRAGDFGFTESYPKENPWGVVYEPWHWRHEK